MMVRSSILAQGSKAVKPKEYSNLKKGSGLEFNSCPRPQSCQTETKL